ncbi:MAG: hypothetical protein IJ876_04925 [Elusimicrobiaceae bacterium]|nr:hypothetical protein [Elusimicrobiaceae bacterium]
MKPIKRLLPVRPIVRTQLEQPWLPGSATAEYGKHLAQNNGIISSTILCLKSAVFGAQ